MDDGRERDEDTVSVGFVDPNEAMCCQDEQARFEGREVAVFFGLDINRRHQRALDFAREEDGAAAAGEVDGRQPFAHHGEVEMQLGPQSSVAGIRHSLFSRGNLKDEMNVPKAKWF